MKREIASAYGGRNPHPPEADTFGLRREERGMRKKYSAMCSAFLILQLAFLILPPAEGSFNMHPASALILGRGGWSVADESKSGLDNCAPRSEKLDWEAGGANFYGISDLNEYYLSLTVPTDMTNINFIQSTLKYSSVYRESIYSICFSRKLSEKINAGLRFNTFELDAAEFEEGTATRRIYSDYDLGLVRMEKYFNAGVTVASINSKEVTFKKIPEKEPVKIRYGVMLKPVKGAKIGLDYVSGEPLSAGVQVEVVAALRSSVGIRKNVFTAGFSLRLPVFWLNFSLMADNDLGNTYFISVSRN